MRLPGKGMSWKEFFTALQGEISRDNVTDIAATVTYYGILALFPFLLFIVALASLFIQPKDADQVVQQLQGFAPGAATQIVGAQLHSLAQNRSVGLLTFGVLAAIWAASGAMSALLRALNVVYDVKEGRPYWKVQGLAVVMTLFSGVLALVAAAVAVAAGPIGEAIGGPIGTAIVWLRLPVAGAAMMFLWAVLYYVLPDVEQDFRFITPGSVGGVIVWVIASWGFSMYVSHFGNYDKTYGSLGGVIVLLLWMWISSLVVLVGAEVNAVIEHRSPEGKREGAKSMRDKGTTPATGSGAAHPEGHPAAVARPTAPAPAPVAAAVRGDGSGGSRGPEEHRPRLRGIAAIAAGFAAGALLTRNREA